MLDKKQIWAIFLFKFKMGCEAVETPHNINKAFGPGTANTCTVQWWFKKFCKGEESPEGEERSDRPSEVDNHQLRAITGSWSSYNYTRTCWRTQCQPFYSHLAFEANWKNEKAR